MLEVRVDAKCVRFDKLSREVTWSQFHPALW